MGFTADGTGKAMDCPPEALPVNSVNFQADDLGFTCDLGIAVALGIYQGIEKVAAV